MMAEYLIIYSSSTIPHHTATLPHSRCCQVCHPATFTISQVSKDKYFGETADTSICNETFLAWLRDAEDKRLLILCFVHTALSKSIIGYLLHGDRFR